MNGKAVIIKADGQEVEIKTPISLEDGQAHVGSSVERLTVLYEGKQAVMLVDGDGRLKKKPLNITATEIYHTASINKGDRPDFSNGDIPSQYIVGNVILMTDDAQGEWT